MEHSFPHTHTQTNKITVHLRRTVTRTHVSCTVVLPNCTVRTVDTSFERCLGVQSSDETGVYGTLGVITSVPSLSLRDEDRMVPPPALKYTK